MSDLEHFPPVETHLGESVRRVAITNVGHRYKVLTDRARSRELTSIERSEIIGAENVLGTLQAMAPIAALQPARAKGQLQLSA